MVANKSVLLVEGRDDREVVFQFCNHYKLDNRSCFLTEAKDGYGPLIDDFSVRIKSGINVLGAIVDADQDISVRWQSINSMLTKFGYAMPDEPVNDGLIVDSPHPTLPKVGIWLMPNNKINGILEDFLLMLADAHDSALSRARDAVTSIPPGEQRFKDCHVTKAIAHTWLAWQEEPGTPLGQAITKCYLDPAKEPAPAFKTWLINLFGLNC